MMPLFRQERCAPWAPIQCHADFTSRERQHHLAQHDKQYTLVFGDANESVGVLVMLMDSRYVVMQMNWPFLVTGESQ
jgi:hypothetical protein